MIRKGIVLWYNQDLGYGFVALNVGAKQVFFHHSAVRDCETTKRGKILLRKGQQVWYERFSTDKGLRARKVFTKNPGGKSNL